MAKSGEPQREEGGNAREFAAGSTSRVYTSKDVHRRRAGGKARAKLGDLPTVLPEAPAGEADGDASTERAARRASLEAVPSPVAAAGETASVAQPGFAPAIDAEAEPGPELAPALAVPASAGHAPAPEPEPTPAPAPAEPAGPAPEVEAPVEPRSSQPAEAKPRIRAKHVAFAAIGLILVVAVAFCSAFAWNRWGRYDDHADMQGQWYVRGTTVPVTIDEQAIHLTDDVAYEYELDDHDKMVSYTFGPMEGQGRYWFSGDRANLAFIDGEGFTGVGNTVDDLVRWFGGLVSGDASANMPEGEGVIVLSREPGKLATMAKDAAERATKRAEAKKEQAEREAEREAARKAAEEEAAEQAAQEAAAAEQAAQEAAAAVAAEEVAEEPVVEEYYEEQVVEEYYDDSADEDYID